jgi:hypothetical protein
MSAIISGIFAGIFVSHWAFLFVFPAGIGLYEAISTALGFSFEEKCLTEKAKVDSEAQAELEFFKRRRPTMSILAFFFSSAISFIPCLIVGGIRLMFFN